MQRLILPSVLFLISFAVNAQKKDSLVVKPNKVQLELITELDKKINDLQQELIKNICLVIGYRPEELEGQPHWDGEKFIFKLKTKK